MVLKSIKFGLTKKALVFLCFTFMPLVECFPQKPEIYNDSVFTMIFDAQLAHVDLKTGRFIKKPIIIVSNRNCAGCINHFLKDKLNFNFIFLISTQSLLEIQRMLKSRPVQD